MIDVIVVDDHPTIRMGLHFLLENTPDINFVGEAECGIRAIECTAALKPDILLLDNHLPDMDGSEVTRKIQQLDVKTSVLGFSGFSDIDRITEMLNAGAKGYVLKTEPPGMLLDAIRAVARGETWVSPTIANKFLTVTSRKFLNHQILSKRELEVLKLLANGYNNRQIAASLVISRSTVKNHLSNIYSTLAVGSRAEAIIWAWSNGLTARDISKAREENIGQSS